MANTGTYSVDDLIQVKNASAASFGVDKIFESLKSDLAFYNSVVSDQMSLLAENVTEQMKLWGSSNVHHMTQVDEFSVAPSQKAYATSEVAFPLRLYSSSIGWTQKYLDLATPAEIASEYLAVRAGHAFEVSKQIKKAIYNNTNYTFVDKLTNGVSLTVRRFLNADSQVIPDFQGTSFTAASHTHYSARVGGALAGSDIDTLISNVTEHGHTRGLMLVIALADKATVSALTTSASGKFTPLSNAVLVYGASDHTQAVLDNTDLNNQLIGYWYDVPVYVKPWAVANYILCVSTEGEKPLGFRQRPQTALQGLRLVSEIPGYPLISKSFEAEFGVAVNSRSSGAVLYFGDSSWANPTI